MRHFYVAVAHKGSPILNESSHPERQFDTEEAANLMVKNTMRDMPAEIKDAGYKLEVVDMYKLKGIKEKYSMEKAPWGENALFKQA